jgi:molybdopterin/thiamine biosynthesis adenylyltransferase
MMKAKINQLISAYCKTAASPSGQNVNIIDRQSVNQIASETGTSLLDTEIACLKRSVIPLRYLRNIGTIGIEGQLKLLRATVAVCGLGGLGGTICELLARQGIGHLIITDQDNFEENNLNRQIMATENDIGKPKVEMTAARIGQINSAVIVTMLHESIDVINIKKMIDKADAVLDGLDNFATRRVVVDACRDLNIPFVHGAIAGFYGQVMTIYPGDKGIDAICGPSSANGSAGLEKIVGTPSATPFIIAAWQVQEAVKVITGIGQPIRHRLLLLDFESSIVDDVHLC